MSIFDYPRINIKGTVKMNPGTANNDDYAAAYVLPPSWGPFAGAAFGLIDSKTVTPRTFGMSDETFIAWAQKAQPFVAKDTPHQTRQIIPAEWNYYGDMSVSIVEASVVGVQTGSDQLYTEPDDTIALTQLLGTPLSYYGNLTDVNSEGSPPATQFFIQQLTLGPTDTPFIKGQPNKSTSQWLNFYRNVNLTADGGAGAYVYHIIPKSQDNTINLPGYDDPNICGVIFRYYLYRRLGGASTNEAIEALYEQKTTNPVTLEIVGTFTPLYQSEPILSVPTGRLMISNTPQIPTPTGSQNNGGSLVALAPGVVQTQKNVISADFVGTFPDYYLNGANPKYDFGPVTLILTNGSQSVDIGPVDYANTLTGDQKGWVFDFDISSNSAAQHLLQDKNATFKLVHPTLGNILAETDYYFVTNQQGIYAEQFGPGDQFLNQGTTEPATIAVYHRGQALTAETCPPITVWQYRSIPLQAPGNAEPLDTNFKPGQPLAVNTNQPGNFLFTFSTNDATNPPPVGYPPQSYNTFMNPPYITNASNISLRILPNDVNFSRYYVDPSDPEPVGNEQLTFDIVYKHVLQTYYLLYPAMNKVIPLNSECVMSQPKTAQAVLQRTDPAMWMSNGYMPITRDMSLSRRTLLRAWCHKVLQQSSKKK